MTVRCWNVFRMFCGDMLQRFPVVKQTVSERVLA